MSVTAEQLAIAVPEMQDDLFVIERAQRFIGQCALDTTVQLFEAENVEPIESLHDAIQQADVNEPESAPYKLVETNVKTDVVERTMKTGHVIKVNLHADEAGAIHQFGQTIESVQANSLRYAANNPAMLRRTEAEATNSFRLKQHYEEGSLEDYYFVVFSPAADDMTNRDMESAGFFTETMSCAIQVTTVEDGELTMESAFVSGISEPGAKRHDIESIIEVADKLDIDMDGKSATEILGTPLLIPKSMMPDGVIDLVEMYDSTMEGDTFFGENRPKQDYLDYLKVCEEREERFQPKVDKITQSLILNKANITDRIKAVEELHNLSEAEMVAQAIGDTDIDPRVFGPDSARHIIEARYHYEQGNVDELRISWDKAVKSADSSSCPSGLRVNESGETENSGQNEDKDCEFVSKQCPMCGKKNVKTTVTKHKIEGSCGCSKSK